MLLVCLFALVFYLYSIRFNLVNDDTIIKNVFEYIVDLKTILTVLGTIFGAYFGAKVAGTYAVHSVEKQIDYQKSLELRKERRILLKVLAEYISSCEATKAYFQSISTTVEDIKSSIITYKDPYLLVEAMKFIKPRVDSLKEIDTSEIYGGTYFKVKYLGIQANHLIENIKQMANYIETNQRDLFLSEKILFDDTLLEFDSNILELREELNKIL